MRCLTFLIKFCMFSRWNIVVLPTYGVANKIAHCHRWMAKVILTLLVLNTASVESLSNDTASKKGVRSCRTATVYTRNEHLMVIQNVFVSSNFLPSWCELRAWRENSCWSAYVEYSSLFWLVVKGRIHTKKTYTSVTNRLGYGNPVWRRYLHHSRESKRFWTASTSRSSW